MPPSVEETPCTSRWWWMLPYAVFAVFFVLTFKRWILPFQDSGRELGVAMRIARGAVLYRDVEYYYGPLSPLIDAACVRLFGSHLDVLIALRTVVGLLGLEALRRLAGRVAPDAASASAITAFIVAACFFDTGGAYPFPYSVAALEATVGTWWALELALVSRGWGATLVAGLVAGLTAATKLEAVPMAIGSMGVVLAVRRPRGEAAIGVSLAAGLAAAAFVVPCVLLGADVMNSHGYLHLFNFPSTLLHMYEFSVLYGGMTAAQFRGGGWVDAFFPSALYLAIVLLGLGSSFSRSRTTAGICFLAGLTAIWSKSNAEIHILLLLAAAIGTFDVASAMWSWLGRGKPVAAARCGIAVAMAPALARQPFFLRNLIYGAFSAPLALLTSLAWVARRVAARGAFVALLIGLTVAQGVHRWQDVGSQPDVWTELPRASLYLPAEESAFLRELAVVLPRVVPEGGWVVVMPETGFVNFMTGFENPFIVEQFVPEGNDVFSEDSMIRMLEERKPVLVISNRSLGEYSQAAYGQGFLDRFFETVRRNYVAVGRVGEMPLVPRRQRHASAGVLLVPADRVRTEGVVPTPEKPE